MAPSLGALLFLLCSGRRRMARNRSAARLKNLLSLPILLDSVPLCLPVWQAVSLRRCRATEVTEIVATQQADAGVEGSVGDDRGRIDGTAPRTLDAKTFGRCPRRRHG